MRILHLTDRLTERGGAGWHLLAVLAALGEMGHELHVAAGAQDDGVRPPCPLTLLPGLEARSGRAVDLEPLLRRFRPDVVHLHTVVNPAVLGWAAGGQPAVVTVQDHRYFCPSRGKWTAAGEPCREAARFDLCAACFEDPGYFRDVYTLTAARLEAVRRLRVIALSRYMRGELVQAGVPADRVAVVPPFVHGLDPAATADGPPCVLFAGRLTAAKGVRDAVAAWRASAVGLPLVVAGTGPLRGELEASGARLLGWVPHARLSTLYRRARAVVMPSRWQEPFGIVGLESLTLGTPVAAWDSGGVAEWHPGGGLLAPWGDVAALAEALGRAVDRTAEEPAGFGRGPLMDRLAAVYRSV